MNATITTIKIINWTTFTNHLSLWSNRYKSHNSRPTSCSSQRGENCPGTVRFCLHTDSLQNQKQVKSVINLPSQVAKHLKTLQKL